jgi:hypothetical protein
MTTDQFGSILRAFGALITSALVGWGVDSVLAGLTSGAIIAVGLALWGWFNNKPETKVATGLKSLGVDPSVAKGGTVIIDGVPVEWSIKR